MFKKSTLKPASIRKRKRNRALGWIILLLFVLGGLVWGVVYFFNLPKFLLSEMQVEGNNAVSMPEVQTTVAKELNGKYFGLIPRNSSFLYPEQKIEDQIRKEHLRFSSVDVSRKGLHQLHVLVIEREAVGLWCKSKNENGILKPLDECYFMDNTGYIFAQAPSYTGGLYNRFYGLIEDQNPLTRTYSIQSGTISEMSAFMKEVADLASVEIEGLFARGNGEYEIAITGGGRIIFNDQISLRDLISNLETVLQEDKLKNAKAGEIEYIDLRFGNKVYYKIKDSAVTE